MQFRNSVNGYTESASAPVLWAFLFGPFYFAFKGAWGHAVIYFVLAVLTSGLVWLIYPWFASSIVRGSYLRAGWHELPDEQMRMAVVRTNNLAARRAAA